MGSHSLACQITSPFNNKLGCFYDEIKKITFQNSLSNSWMGQLYGKPVSDSPLSKELDTEIEIESNWDWERER